jgi:hypothetical protein
MSQAPYLLPATARSPGLRLGSAALRDSMVSDGLTDAYKHIHMGVVAEATANEYQISRKDQVTTACPSLHSFFFSFSDLSFILHCIHSFIHSLHSLHSFLHALSIVCVDCC